MTDANVDVEALLGSVYQGSDSVLNSNKSDNDKEVSENKKRERQTSSDNYSPERKRRKLSSDRNYEDEKKEYKKERSPSPIRKRTRSPLRRREKTPPELSPDSQAEQDSRTVFVAGLPTTATENDLKPFFEQAGKVKVISLIGDRNSRRSKGIGYIQYESRESIPNALGLNGNQFQKHTISIQATMAEKNITMAKPIAKQVYKLLVSNLDPRLSEDDILYFFEQVGTAKEVVFTNNNDYNKSKGNGERPPKKAIVTYKKADEAKKAVEFCNGFKFLNFSIQVEHYQGSSFLHNGSGESRIDLDADDQGIKLDGATRLALMQRLSQRPAVNQQVNQSNSPAPILAANIPKSLEPTIFIVLKNMFDPSEAVEDPELFIDVKEAVTEECSKFGAVEDIFTDEKSPDGLVYIQLDSVKAAEQTKSLLDGRWYAGKMVSVDYISASVYRSRRALTNK